MVDYSKFDGIADSDDETTEPVELGTTREAGNALFKQKDATGALSHYEQAMEHHPRHLVYQLNCAAALLELGEYERAIKTCKTLVSACRSWQYRVRIAEKHAGATDPKAPSTVAAQLARVTGGKVTVSELLSRAYARIGSAFKRQGKVPRATNAFMLSLKETESAEVRKQLVEC